MGSSISSSSLPVQAARPSTHVLDTTFDSILDVRTSSSPGDRWSKRCKVYRLKMEPRKIFDKQTFKRVKVDEKDCWHEVRINWNPMGAGGMRIVYHMEDFSRP